jgi:hypothetical protein
MKLTTDERCRLASQELFKPRTDYEAEKQGLGRIVLTEVGTLEIPTLKPQRVNGRLRGAAGLLRRDIVAAAVRADRDAR